MDKSSPLMDIKYTALYLQEKLVGTDPEKVKMAYDEFQALVDRFYRENRDRLNERHYRASRDNFDFFMVVLEGLINDENAETGTGERS